MSRKKKKRRPRPRRPPAPARFANGTEVRVKPGVKVPDFPDIPLGGWSGTISDVEEGPHGTTYLIEWDRRTLDQMHPVFRKRCERDDLEAERMWLAEDDVEPNTGEPAPIEQPTQIITRPLQMNDQDDRIRAILGLTSDDPLPDADEDNLRTYHAHLAGKLRFPFVGSWSEEVGPFREQRHRITVMALLDPDEGDEDSGLLCEAQEGDEPVVLPLADLENVAVGPNRQLVADYAYWVYNWQGVGTAGRLAEQELLPPADSVDAPPGEAPASAWGLVTTLVKVGLLGGFYGAVLGAALASLDGAALAAKVGAILLAVVGGLLGASCGPWFGAVNRIRHGNWFGGSLGLVAGALLGAMLGVMVVGFLGTLAGALAGAVLGWLLGSAAYRPIRTTLGVVGGAMLGVGVHAWLHNAEAAPSGAWMGGLAGMIVAPVLFFVMMVVLVLLDLRRSPE